MRRQQGTSWNTVEHKAHLEYQSLVSDLVLESEYRRQFGRNLTLSRLNEAVILPLCPDKGSCLAYDPNLSPSVYLENDLHMLRRARRILG